MTKEEMTKRVHDFVRRVGKKGSAGQIVAHSTIDFIWSLILDGRPEGTCEHCSETFPMTRKDQKFCKNKCKRTFHDQRRKTRDTGRDYEE